MFFRQGNYCLRKKFGFVAALVLGGCTSGDGGDPVVDDNVAPVAQATATPNDTVINTPITLDGAMSTDSDGTIAAYAWTQQSGATVTINNANTVTASITAPASAGDIVFQLTVTDDDGATGSSTVTVTITVPTIPVPPNSPPIADAGPDMDVAAGANTSLNGSGSSDSDGTIASYRWSQLSGASVSLDDSSIAQPVYTTPSINSQLVFQLVVTDNVGATDMDTVTITISDGNNAQPGLDARPSNTTCIAPTTPGTSSGAVQLIDVFPNLDLSEAQFPLGMFQLPGNNNFFYIITRIGKVLRFDNNPAATVMTEVLDISGQVNDFNFEGGFLGMAFHPQIVTNRAVYLSYTASGGGAAGKSVFSRFTMTDDATIDPSSEQVILEVNQPAGNHNGGDIAFGPDGYLYIGLGDGGGQNDPQGHGQNTNTLLGAMLRINVDPVANVNPFYTIPDDNPFVVSGGAPEIYAYGLRNPFRWSFDTGTGILWVADVGQQAQEEVDHIDNGGNYGWDIKEGNICSPGADCSTFVDPVHTYPRTVGSSITGGYVYRGSENATLDGAYIFGDYIAGSIWTLVPFGTGYARTEVATAPPVLGGGGIVAFAQDNDGEVYVLTALPQNGRSILKIQPSGGSPGSNIPDLLSATGCFSTNPMTPAAGLIPFDVANPLWSDGAQKLRWMALPDGGTVDVDAQGDFDFPTGTILAKHFMNGGILIETRLLMLHQTGWAGYSYQWRADQMEADLLPDALDQTVAGLNWHFPSRAECRQCHTTLKNFALAPEVLQLNHDFTYSQTGRTANQIFTLNTIGVFSAPPDGSLNGATLFAMDDTTATLEARVKSYLHSNCSQCHLPGGTGGAIMDLRFETPLSGMNICNVLPSDDLGNMNARLIVPGSPADSVILTRMEASVASGIRMPLLATEIVDTAATTVFTDWINSLSVCP